MKEHQRNERINFVKHVILETKGNLNLEIDPDAMWNNLMLNR